MSSYKPYGNELRTEAVTQKMDARGFIWSGEFKIVMPFWHRFRRHSHRRPYLDPYRELAQRFIRMKFGEDVFWTWNDEELLSKIRVHPIRCHVDQTIASKHLSTLVIWLFLQRDIAKGGQPGRNAEYLLQREHEFKNVDCIDAVVERFQYIPGLILSTKWSRGYYSESSQKTINRMLRAIELFRNVPA